MQTIPHLPLADLADVLSGLMPIIFVILYGIAHLVGNLQQEKRKAPPRPKAPERPEGFAQPAGAAKPAAGNQPSLEETLRREVEEFLRRAQGQQPQQEKPEKQKPGQRQPQRAQQQRGGQRPLQPQGRRPPQRQPEPELKPVRRLVETERAEPAAPLSPLSTPRPLPSASPLGTGAALHSQTIVEHAHALGSDIAQADERMEAHLREKFTHQLGALAPAAVTRDQQAVAAANTAMQLREMISRPETVRQIIIASEILRRPEDRWEGFLPSVDARS